MNLTVCGIQMKLTFFWSSGKFFHASPDRLANSSLFKSLPIVSRTSFEKNKNAEMAFLGPLNKYFKSSKLRDWPVAGPVKKIFAQEEPNETIRYKSGQIRQIHLMTLPLACKGMPVTAL